MDTQRIISELSIVSKCDASQELFLYLLRKTRRMLEVEFGKPTSYYGSEKECVLMCTAAMYSSIVTPEMLAQLQSIQAPSDATSVEEVHLPQDDIRAGTIPDYEDWGES